MALKACTVRGPQESIALDEGERRTCSYPAYSLFGNMRHLANGSLCPFRQLLDVATVDDLWELRNETSQSESERLTAPTADGGTTQSMTAVSLSEM